MSIRIVAHDPQGRPIEAVRLSSGAMQAEVLSIGAALWDLRLEGLAHPLILGWRDPARYLENPERFGVIVGPVANRIGGGTARIAGKRHHFDRNEGGLHCLHGGRAGSGRRLWRLKALGAAEALFADTLPDGHMGFPGPIEVRARYALRKTTLTLAIEAWSPAATFCNFAPHIYFNLSGAEDIAAHRIEVKASSAIPVRGGIPTAGPQPTAAPHLPDLRGLGPVPRGIDLNYCIDAEPGALRPVALLEAGQRQRPVRMALHSTEPGLQVYDASTLDAPPGSGLAGRSYGPRAGLALEPQRWIDAPNQSWHAQVALWPGALYRSQSAFVFSQG